MLKIFRYRLYPTQIQVSTIDSHLELCRELYNAALQERREAWRTKHALVSFNTQSAQLPLVKRVRPELKNVYGQVLQDVLRRVDRNHRGMFSRIRHGRKAGFPRFRSATRYDSLTYPQYLPTTFRLEDRYLKVPKIGCVKIKWHRPVEGEVKTLTIKREAGKWYACFTVKVEAMLLPESSQVIGIDLGLTTFATLSDGTEIANPRYYRKSQAALRIAQRKIARRKKGSHRRRKAARLLRQTSSHVRNQRNDFHHKESRSLIDRYGLIVTEDLNIQGLASGILAKDIHDAGWSSFIDKLTYKAEYAGRQLVKVDPRGTSQTCLCGASVPKTLSQRWHSCKACGLEAPRDVVSAQLILGRGLRLQALTSEVALCVA